MAAVAWKAVRCTQALAHARQQRLLLGTGQIANRDARRVGLSAGAAYRDQRNPVLTAMNDQRDFGLGIVDRINHVIIATRQQQLRDVVRIDEFLNLGDLAIRIDLRNARAQRTHLGHAQRIGQRVNLPIHIRLGQMIQVNQGELADRGARQRFDRPGADTTDTDHTDMGMAKRRQRRVTIQARDTAKTTLDVDIRRTALSGKRDNRKDAGHGRILTDAHTSPALHYRPCPT